MASGDDIKNFFDTHNWTFEKCLEPALQCSAKAIRAHSIQNARVFDLLSTQNHVSMFRLKVTRVGPEIILRKVGRNEASTFSGFCSGHDSKIFRALDNSPLDLENREQLFLLAYRSVSRELHATMEAASKLQSAYLRRVEKGWDDSEVPTPAGMEALGRAVVSWMTYRYRNEGFDLDLLNGDFSKLEHDVTVFSDQSPTVAASCLFSIDEIVKDKDIVRAVLNVVPLNTTETAVVFTYTNADASRARIALDRVLQSVGFQQKYELSKLLLERTENFALSPAFVESWNEVKLAKVKAAFISTMFENGITEDGSLMLF